MAKFTGRDAQGWILPVSVGLVIIVGWKYFGAPLLEKLGLKESGDDKDRIETEDLPQSKDYWSPGFYKIKPYPAGVTDKVLTTQKFAVDASKTIWDSINTFDWLTWVNDDENRIYGVFRQLQYKTQISFVADWFFYTYKKDLYQFLRSYLNDSEMGTLLTITNKKLWGFKRANGTIY